MKAGGLHRDSPSEAGAAPSCVSDNLEDGKNNRGTLLLLLVYILYEVGPPRYDRSIDTYQNMRQETAIELVMSDALLREANSRSSPSFLVLLGRERVWFYLRHKMENIIIGIEFHLDTTHPHDTGLTRLTLPHSQLRLPCFLVVCLASL